jgi:hypothetical protein
MTAKAQRCYGLHAHSRTYAHTQAGCAVDAIHYMYAGCLCRGQEAEPEFWCLPSLPRDSLPSVSKPARHFPAVIHAAVHSPRSSHARNSSTRTLLASGAIDAPVLIPAGAPDCAGLLLLEQRDDLRNKCGGSQLGASTSRSRKRRGESAMNAFRLAMAGAAGRPP